MGYFLVPPMRILTEEQATKMLKKYGIEKEQLPKMFSSDPEAQGLKANPGDVVSIERKDITSKYVAYRLVVEG